MNLLDWSVIGGLFALVASTIAHLYQRTSGFAEFRAMDEEREQHWAEWRRSLEKRIEDQIKSQADWRHNELSPSLKRIEEMLTTIKETVRQLEKMRDKE